MRNLKKLLLLIFTTGIIISCSRTPEHTKTVTALPLEDTLEAETVSVESETEFINLIKIANVNEEYLVFVDDVEQGVFKVFSLPDLVFQYVWGRMGRGPDELSFVSLKQIDVFRDQLLFYEEPYARMKFYRVTDSVLTFTREQDLSFKNKRNPINGLKIMDDSLLIARYGYGGAATISEDEFIALAPGNRDPLFTFGSYPKTELEGAERSQQYSKLTAARPGGSRFAAFYRKYNRFKIFDHKGSLISEVHVNDPSLPEISENSDFIYRFAASAGEKYIYTLAVNSKEQDLENNPLAAGMSVEIWTWDGDPVKRFYIDPPTPRFAISEKHNRMYGFSLRMDNAIYEYNLEKIIDLN